MNHHEGAECQEAEYSQLSPDALEHGTVASKALLNTKGRRRKQWVSKWGFTPKGGRKLAVRICGDQFLGDALEDGTVASKALLNTKGRRRKQWVGGGGVEGGRQLAV